MTRRRKRRPRERGRRLLERPRSEERRNIAKWKKSERRCGKRSEIRSAMTILLTAISAKRNFRVVLEMTKFDFHTPIIFIQLEFLSLLNFVYCRI